LSVVARRLEQSTGHTGHEGDAMIDWDSDTWGGGVTYAADGSWLGDKQAVPTSAHRQSHNDD
jgi:hypothetical protein